MSIKDKIVGEAILLFNRKGIASVTMRQVAELLGISPGNLTYHYKTKESMLKVIYQQMHDESKDYIVSNGYITLHDFEQILVNFYQLRKKYSFFFNDVVYISHQFPAVAKLYENANLMRFSQSRALVNFYVETERMIPESQFVDYDKLVLSIWMINTFWSSQEQILNATGLVSSKTTPVEMAWQMLFPYLTEKGREEYIQIKKFVKSKI